MSIKLVKKIKKRKKHCSKHSGRSSNKQVCLHESYFLEKETENKHHRVSVSDSL